MHLVNANNRFMFKRVKKSFIAMQNSKHDKKYVKIIKIANTWISVEGLSPDRIFE